MEELSTDGFVTRKQIDLQVVSVIGSYCGLEDGFVIDQWALDYIVLLWVDVDEEVVFEDVSEDVWRLVEVEVG